MGWEKLSKHKSAGGLGFRNFRDFNLSLLGKQGWRLLTRPDSLSTKLFKARYFPEGNFIDAKLGNNPSFVWRSIWEAKDVVLSGVRWRVGTGACINILGQPWLQDELNPMVTSDAQALQPQKVHSLLKFDRQEWDVDLIRDLFNSKDQQQILKIPLSEDNTVDEIFWNNDASGNYSVRSAYKTIQLQKGLWNWEDKDSLWSKLWRIRAPSKVLNMFW